MTLDIRLAGQMAYGLIAQWKNKHLDDNELYTGLHWLMDNAETSVLSGNGYVIEVKGVVRPVLWTTTVTDTYTGKPDVIFKVEREGET